MKIMGLEEQDAEMKVLSILSEVFLLYLLKNIYFRLI
jgi:hypothetical protein